MYDSYVLNTQAYFRVQNFVVNKRTLFAIFVKGMVRNMLENIVFAIMVLIAIGAGIWVLWLEKHDKKPSQPSTNEEG